jgi:exo-beta-1,3-glucanase (GH17 family)
MVEVSAPNVVHKLFGADFGPYEAGQSPSTGAISVGQITQRIGVIAPYTQWIRSYSSTNGLENIGAIGHKFGLKVCMGATLTSDTSANGVNAMEMANLIQHALNGDADCAIVGNETLSSSVGSPSLLTTSELTKYIDQFRAAVPNVPVATSDTYFDLLNNPDVVNDGDLLLVNYYPFWEGADISAALADLNAEDVLLRLTYPAYANKIWISETGWPTGGDTVANEAVTSNAVPSLANATTYFLDFESWAQSIQRNAFYFEAFDEAWKATTAEPQQGLFGIFDQNAEMKYGEDVFAGQTQSDNWTCTTVPGGTGTPAIQLTTVPPRLSSEPTSGTGSYLQGQALHIAPAAFYVVVYIHVGTAGWFVKPYTTSPLTITNCDGTWAANIDTGGEDATADQVAAFLVPSTYTPPLLLGAQTLPAALFANAVANVNVDRP